MNCVDESPSRDVSMGDVSVGAAVGSSVGLGEGHAAGNANPGAGDAWGLGQVDAQDRLDGAPSSSRGFRSILAREGVWKPLGGGVALRSSVETLSRCLMTGWKSGPLASS